MIKFCNAFSSLDYVYFVVFVATRTNLILSNGLITLVEVIVDHSLK